MPLGTIVVLFVLPLAIIAAAWIAYRCSEASAGASGNGNA